MPVEPVLFPTRYADRAPGVYTERLAPRLEGRVLTGVPAFLGYAGPPQAQGQPTLQHLTLWAQFSQHFSDVPADGYLADAVRGFFANGGEQCYVLPLQGDDPLTALTEGLERLAALDRVDLVCAPDIMRGYGPGRLPDTALAQVQAMQQAVVQHCEACGERLALLDARPDPHPGTAVAGVLQQRAILPGAGQHGANAALYYPWLEVPRPGLSQGRYVPPCGHVAGVYARSDRAVGVHKAPANAVVEGALDTQTPLTEADHGRLNQAQVNCIRALPGRGIRLWGARTLSSDPAWLYVNVRRLFLTVGRWLERSLAAVAFEPHDVLLWARIERELRAYCSALFRAGALQGATAEEAFFVQCDATTNPPGSRDLGRVVTDLGLAPVLPNEFVVVRLIQEASGVTLAPPAPGR